MAGEIIKPTADVKQAFEVGEAVNFNNFEYRWAELKAEKDQLATNIDAINKRLRESLNFFTMSDTLNKDELQQAIEITDGELNNLEKTANEKIEEANRQFEISNLEGESGIIEALSELNKNLGGFLTERLQSIIHEADLADGDKEALLARLYPQPKKKTFAEETIAAMEEHHRRIREIPK